MKYFLFCLTSLLIFFSCQKKTKPNIVSELYIKKEKTNLANENGNTISTRFTIPAGFERVKTKSNSFANYLQNFKLKPHNPKVYLHNGKLKSRQDVHAAVLDIDVGKKDLQQCADAIMRLKAEFLYKQKRYHDFNFTNGFNFTYSKWQKGHRLNIKGNKVNWYQTNKNSTSYTSFNQYMQLVFMYAGTLSLSKEMKPIRLKNIQIGDVFIQGGSPGHAVIVVDMAINSTNEILFLLAQSYMPAQDIHVLKNLNNTTISPWYSTKNLEILKSPEWNFTKENLSRFP